MEVDRVGDVTSTGDPNVRGDESTTRTIRQQVPILHAGAADAESVARPHERERRIVGRHVDGETVADERDRGAVRSRSGSAPASSTGTRATSETGASWSPRTTRTVMPKPPSTYVDGSSAGEIVSIRKPDLGGEPRDHRVEIGTTDHRLDPRPTWCTAAWHQCTRFGCVDRHAEWCISVWRGRAVRP